MSPIQYLCIARRCHKRISTCGKYNFTLNFIRRKKQTKILFYFNLDATQTGLFVGRNKKFNNSRTYNRTIADTRKKATRSDSSFFFFLLIFQNTKKHTDTQTLKINNNRSSPDFNDCASEPREWSSWTNTAAALLSLYYCLIGAESECCCCCCCFDVAECSSMKTFQQRNSFINTHSF